VKVKLGGTCNIYVEWGSTYNIFVVESHGEKRQEDNEVDGGTIFNESSSHNL